MEVGQLAEEDPLRPTTRATGQRRTEVLSHLVPLARRELKPVVSVGVEDRALKRRPTLRAVRPAGGGKGGAAGQRARRDRAGEPSG